MEIRFVHLSTGLGPKSGIAFLALYVASTSLEQDFPFCLILGCGKVYASSTCSGFICKLIPDSASSYAFAGALVPADCCWPQLSFPLCANVKWILAKQPFLIHAKKKRPFAVLCMTTQHFKYMTSPLQNQWDLPLSSYVVQLLPGSSCSTSFYSFAQHTINLKWPPACTSCAGSSVRLCWVIIADSQGKKITQMWDKCQLLSKPSTMNLSGQKLLCACTVLCLIQWHSGLQP